MSEAMIIAGIATVPALLAALPGLIIAIKNLRVAKANHAIADGNMTVLKHQLELVLVDNAALREALTAAQGRRKRPRRPVNG